MVPFKEGAFKLAKNLKIPIIPITFINNHKLLTDPGNAFGPAHPGISKIYIHDHIPASKIEELTEDELRKLCFDIVNEPLLGIRC
jgi:1-acyl-sn-glycerol-3-phosphate acyltransferase